MVSSELNHDRELYAGHVEAPLHRMGLPNTSRTKVSGLATSLCIAANEPRTLPHNVEMVLGKIMKLAKGEEFEDLSDDTDVDYKERNDIDGHPLSDDICTVELVEPDDGRIFLPCSENNTASSVRSDDDSGVDLVCN